MISRRTIIGRLLTTVLSVVASYALMFIIGSHSGTDDPLRMAPVIVLLAFIFPLAGGFYLGRFWPLASLAFSWILIAMIINRSVSDLPAKTADFLVPLAGIVASIISAGIGSRIASKQNTAVLYGNPRQ